MAKDLKRELPGISGFSRTNLFSMRKFFSFYKDSSIVHQAAGLLQNTEKQESIIVQQAAGLICYDNILNNIYFKPKYN